MKVAVSVLISSTLLLFSFPAIAADRISIVPQVSLLLSDKKDCNGDLGGSAYINLCNVCVGGNTGLLFECVQSYGGQIWMDRNLGATQVATSMTDTAAYGDLYQWGRCTDGHEKRTSPTTAIPAYDEIPGHGNFIITSSDPFDWYIPGSELFWQGLAGTNNPCPDGLRLPTTNEWYTEMDNWSGTNALEAAYSSNLKIVNGGRRFTDGNIVIDPLGVAYWTSDRNGITRKAVTIIINTGVPGQGGYGVYEYPRGIGYAVRCIKD